MTKRIRNTHTAPTQPGTGDGCSAPDNGAVEREARRIHLLVSTLIKDSWRADFERDCLFTQDPGDWLISLRIWQGRIERGMDRLQAELDEACEALRNFGINDPEAVKDTPNGSPNVAGLQVELWYWKWVDAKKEIAAWLGDL